ncbi:MAG: TIM barrel protein [Deltaproteobacteria bacterium]
MSDLKISMGIWGINNLPDRFNVEGFGEFVPVLERIKLCGETEGISGFELHVPTEITAATEKDVRKVMDDYGLRMVQLCGHTWTEKQYRDGALSDLDPKIRSRAIDRVKEALDMGARFDVPISVLWPATDGSDFPLQSDYMSLYKYYRESVREILDYLHENNYKTKLCIEPKPFEPRSHILYGTTGQALCFVNEVNDPSFGINLDVGHALIAGENLEDQFALICYYDKLFHTHFDDNDQQADVDLPPGTVNFIRLVQCLYVLDQAGYDGWYGLDLFPYRDDPQKFMELSVKNLRLAKSVVQLLNEKGLKELRAQKGNGPEVSELIMECIRKAR